jgi:hypothetical protein
MCIQAAPSLEEAAALEYNKQKIFSNDAPPALPLIYIN